MLGGWVAIAAFVSLGTTKPTTVKTTMATVPHGPRDDPRDDPCPTARGVAS